MERYAHITGWGMAVPDRILTNHELARLVDTSDDWIVSRTGIRERHIAGPKETTATLSILAAQRALEMADLDPAEVDLVIVATSTPEHIMPSTACLVQDALGAPNAGAFDLSAACSGFVYGLSMAANAIKSGANNNVLVIGAETFSRLLNWQDRGTCVLFGDGAGAFLLQAKETPGGIINSLLRSDGSGGNSLIVPAGGSKMPTTFETVRDNQHAIQMDGKEVYRFATRIMASTVKDIAQNSGITLDQIQLIVPHQANKRIMESAAKTLGLPPEKFFMNIERYGNTSAASIPIAVCEAVSEGRLRPDDYLVMVGFGGGLTWAATLVKWDATLPPDTSFTHQLRRRASYTYASLRSAVLRSVRRVETIFERNSPFNDNGKVKKEKPPKK